MAKGHKKSKRRLWGILVSIACLTSFAAGGACGVLAYEMQPRQATYAHSDMAQRALAPVPRMTYGAIEDGFDNWFKGYVTSRMVPVPLDQRGPVGFGPWYAERDFGATDARDDGSLTEWAEHYYISHDWSAYGQQVLGMMPGDTVTVNDRTITVQGIFNYPKSSYYDEITTIVGQDAVVFQTCLPDSDLNRIVYGS